MRFLLFVLALSLAGTAAAQQFKWVDQNGKTQYGDTPPPGVKATRLTPPPSGSQPAAPSGSSKAGTGKGEIPMTPEAAFRKRQQEAKEKEEKDAKERADADTRKAGCERSQASLRQ